MLLGEPAQDRADVVAGGLDLLLAAHGGAQHGLPRPALDDVLRVVDDEGAPDRWVMHCFSGDADFARACLDRGAHLSFAGTVTFKNAAPLRDALRTSIYAAIDPEEFRIYMKVMLQLGSIR